MKVRTDGKFFALGTERLPLRGVTYGTFAARDDGALFPEREVVKKDFAAIHEAGFNVVRTYTLPPDDVVDLAADWGLHLLPGVFSPDWRYLVGRSRRDRRRVAASARTEVRAAARRFAGVDHVLALSLGNEVPADVLRWFGTEHIAAVIDELVDVVRGEDDEQLVTYANYPTAEYLPLDGLDFLTFNVFLERRGDFRRYLTRLQHLAGDRPLVLGELGLDAGTTPRGEARQAVAVDWQLETALERGVAGTCLFSWTDEWAVGGTPVEGWHFGLTRADRAPRPALDVVRGWNQRTVRDLRDEWPSISIVVCAYNAASTLDECLAHTCALDYPNLEIIVVDDGSTDDTGEVARRHQRARVVEIDHAGLSRARNAGIEAARGDIVAYLDSDAFPTREWPYYLALAFDSPTVGGAGGPNVPPVGDSLGAQQVARAPGGPVHVLVADDRAEHVPGCNMAFWREVLQEVGGFDPVYTAAGDDVDLCWKVLDRGWEIGFHPAALVWHHRRPGVRTYLRQQRGYGRAEALVEARHPDRFTMIGSARWRGKIYDTFGTARGRQRIYRGIYGTAAYQSVYRGEGHALDIVHQAGLPAVPVAAALSVPLGLATPPLGIALAAATVVFVAVLGALDFARARAPRRLVRGRLRFRAGVALLHLTQPLARASGRLRSARDARRGVEPVALPPARIDAGVLIMPLDRSRADLIGAVVACLRAAGLRVLSPTGWEDHDGRVLGSASLAGELMSSAHPEGFVQLRVRRRPRRAVAWGAVVVLVLGVLAPTAAGFVAAVLVVDAALGWWRTGPVVRRAIAGTRVGSA